MTQQEFPKGWREIPGRKGIYYAVPARVRHLWDDKTTFKLGDNEAQAYRTWFERTGGDQELDKLTFESLIDTYLTQYVSIHQAETTYYNVKYIAKSLKEVFGHLHPESIKPKHIYRYMDIKMEDGLAAGTVHRQAAVASSALDFAVRKGWIEKNVLKGTIQKVGEYKPNVRTRVPTAAELEAFTTGTYKSAHRPDLKSSKIIERPICPDWLKGYVALKMITGPRKGQLLAIDLTHHWDKENQILTPPPSKGGKLTNYRGPGMAEIINKIIGDRLPVGPLFLNSRGKPITKSGFNSAWQRAMRRYIASGGKHFTEHDIRKYTASEAANLEHAQKLLGHQSAKITAQVYRHTAEDADALE